MQPIEVRGGVGGIVAYATDLRAAARQIATLADDVGGVAVSVHAVLLNPALALSAGLDPLGAGDAGAALLAAADGPGGVTALAVRATALSAALEVAATQYEAVDALHRLAAPFVDLAEALPIATAVALRSGPLAGLQDLVARDPRLADVAATTLAVASTGRNAPEAAAALARAFPDGHAVVAPLGPDPGADAAGPPRSLRDLLAGLARRSDGRPGEVDVRVLSSGESGPRRVVVDIPGTRSWSLAAHNPDVTSIATNLRAVSGEPTSYERGVADAMHRAGVRAGDDVLLVGHSEGGMIAVNAATRFTASGEFHIGNVITAGAPLGAIAARAPAAIQILALENASDVVPHVDGRDNPDRANVTTVTLHRDHLDVADDHDLTASYVPGAADVLASGDPSVRASLAGLGCFLSATEVRTERFLITRVYT